MAGDLTVTIVVPASELAVAERLSVILAGTAPREVSGRYITVVPLERIEEALLLEETPRT